MRKPSFAKLEQSIFDEAFASLLNAEKNPLLKPQLVEQVATYTPLALAGAYALTDDDPWYEKALMLGAVGGSTFGSRIMNNAYREGRAAEVLNNAALRNKSHLDIRNTGRVEAGLDELNVDDVKKYIYGANKKALTEAMNKQAMTNAGATLGMTMASTAPVMLLNSLLPNPKDNALAEQALAYQQQYPVPVMMEY